MDKDLSIKTVNLKKKYRLGVIGNSTLTAEIQSKLAKIKKVEDPNTKIGSAQPTDKKEFFSLDGINLEIKKGDVVGIIGTNGAGKSTLLKLLSRVTTPTEGDIYINGRVASMLEVGTGFHPEMTGRENIYLNGAIMGMSKNEIDEKIDSIIEFSECRDFIDTPVKRYSSGMYVKLAFSVASHLESDILIMDEVLAVGDAKFQKKCLEKMGEIANGEGKTVLYVSHNMSTIRNLCKRCIVLKKGKIIFDGDVEEAIDVYLENSKEEAKVHYDLINFQRRDPVLGNKARILSIDLFDKKTASYKCSEKIKIKVTWESLVNSKIGFDFAIKYADGSNLGLCETKESVCAAKNTEYITLLEVDLSVLTAGNYALCLELFEPEDYGGTSELDEGCLMPFELIDDQANNGRTWSKQYWGTIRFNDIKIIKNG